MAKMSPKDRESRIPKQKKRRRSSGNKYLKPGALAQIRYTKALAAKSCTDIGKKGIATLDFEETKKDMVIENLVDRSPSLLSPKSPLMISPINLVKHKFFGTPRTPQGQTCESDSRLESLPIDLLVKILCRLHHDQLRAVFHVSQRIRQAVLLARQFHFNYTTPDRSRQEILQAMTPRPTEHWPFRSKKGKGIRISGPHTPKAPRHGPRPPPRIKLSEIKQIAAVLFQESALPSRCMVPSSLPKLQCKSLASNRVLFYEDELCQAVAQNKLL